MKGLKIEFHWDRESLTATVDLLDADNMATNEDCCNAIFQQLEEMGYPYTKELLIENCKVVFCTANQLNMETTYWELNSDLETPIVYFIAFNAREDAEDEEYEEEEPLDDRDCLESGTGPWAHN